MTGIGNGGELGENLQVLGADFAKLNVCNGFETPIDMCPLGVGKHWGKLLKLGGMKEEEVGTETVDNCAMFTVGRVRDRDVAENSEANAGGLELGSDDLEEIGDF